MIETTVRKSDELNGIEGAYAFHDSEGVVIYIGISDDIGKRIRQHISNCSNVGQYLIDNLPASDSWTVKVLDGFEHMLIGEHNPFFNIAERTGPAHRPMPAPSTTHLFFRDDPAGYHVTVQEAASISGRTIDEVRLGVQMEWLISERPGWYYAVDPSSIPRFVDRME